MSLLREDKSEKPDFTYIAELYPVFARIMRQLQLGEKKYARLNWREAKDSKTFKESALRHNLQYANGQDDEDHAIAAIVNLIIALDIDGADGKGS